MIKSVDKEQIQRLYKNGYTAREIAQLLNISRATVYNYISVKEEKQKKKEQLKKLIDIDTKAKTLEEKIKSKFSFADNLDIKLFSEFENIKFYRVKVIKDDKQEYYIVIACDDDIQFVIQKQDCKFEERADIAYLDKLKRLILKLIDELNETLTEDKIKILLSSDYSTDLQMLNRSKNRFSLRAYKRNSKNKEYRVFPLVNSTRDDIYQILKDIVELRRKIFKRHKSLNS